MNLIDDLSLATSIPKGQLNSLVALSETCILHALVEAKTTKAESVEIDLGIGILKLNICNDAIKYIFKPSQSLESGIIDVFTNNANPLAEKLEKSIANRILKAYKDLL